MKITLLHSLSVAGLMLLALPACSSKADEAGKAGKHAQAVAPAPPEPAKVAAEATDKAGEATDKAGEASTAEAKTAEAPKAALAPGPKIPRSIAGANPALAGRMKGKPEPRLARETSGAAALVKQPAVPTAGAKPSKEVHWNAPIAWTDYAVGLAKAKAEKKPVLLFVYADWCPKCRAWGDAFNDPELLELSKKIIMVKQDQQQAAPWLQEFASKGRYVPRVFFLKADGTFDEGITSGHARFPYFYPAQQVETLKAAIRKALAAG